MDQGGMEMKKWTCMVLAMLVLLSSCNKPQSSPTKTPAQTVVPTFSASPAPTMTAQITPVPSPVPTGVSYTTGLPAQGIYAPIAVSVDNSDPARPQSGIGQADVVYELLMESMAITRFLCIFNDTLPGQIGPVRSVRNYTLDVQDEWKGALIHAGGPGANALPIINIYAKIKDVHIAWRADMVSGLNNEIFFKKAGRKAPHSSYVKLDVPRSKVPSVKPIRHFVFDAARAMNGAPAASFSVKYAASNIVRYVFDDQLGSYLRFQGDAPLIDENTGGQVAIRNIILQYTKYTLVADSLKSLRGTMVGSGKADYFMGGQHFTGTWKRATQNDTTHYFDAQGKEMRMLPGNTWIQVLNSSTKVDVGG